MKFFHFINIRVMILSFVLGLLAIYIVMPESKTIIVYPTPDNVDKIQYKDDADNCFSLKQEEVSCPMLGNIQHIPMQ